MRKKRTEQDKRKNKIAREHGSVHGQRTFLACRVSHGRVRQDDARDQPCGRTFARADRDSHPVLRVRLLFGERCTFQQQRLEFSPAVGIYQSRHKKMALEQRIMVVFRGEKVSTEAHLALSLYFMG
ncbi:MAG: hypothetical protein AAB325_07375 [Pseudomonadota bacterium]